MNCILNTSCSIEKKFFLDLAFDLSEQCLKLLENDDRIFFPIYLNLLRDICSNLSIGFYFPITSNLDKEMKSLLIALNGRIYNETIYEYHSLPSNFKSNQLISKFAI